MSLLALAVLVAWSAPASAAGPPAQAAKKAKKKCKKKKCKKKKASPQTPSTPPASGGTNPPPPSPPDTRTTDQKIDDAVATGAITAEQGLTYKVFAGFADPRLPSQYVGVPDPLSEPPLSDVTAQWDQLSDAAKATLGPFLIPPMHEGSYWDQLIQGATASATPSAALASSRAGEPDPSLPWCSENLAIDFADWHYVEASSGPAAGKVRIWYQDRYAATDAARAQSLMSAMENSIWPKLTTLMGREPLPDFGSTGVCAGGSDAVDIALVDAVKATTTPTLSQENSPAHMIFPRTGSGGTTPYLAHEFMHMIQYAFTFSSGDMASGENKWLKEGTAQWVQDYVSSGQYGIGLTPDQTEWDALPYFFPYPERSLDSTSPDYHQYGSYVFWLWAVRKGGDPNIVRQAWNAVGTQKSLAAAKSTFGSGWAQAWKDFARSNWNQDPVTNYQNWDSITNTPKLAADETLPKDQVTPAGSTVAPVAAAYLRFKPAADTQSLTYHNLGTLSDDAGVQAIIKNKDGTSTVEDWTQVAKKDVPFCNIDELTLVLSNASITPSDNKTFNLAWIPEGSGTGHAAISPQTDACVPNPQGSFSGTAHYDDTVTTVVDWSWSGNVDFDPNGQINPWFPDYFDEVWDNADVATGSITLSGTGTVQGDETCMIDLPAASYGLDPGDGTMMVQPGPQPHYGIQLYGPAIVQGTITCPGDDPYTGGFPSPAAIYTPDAEQTMTRGSYQGSASFSNEFFVENMNWNLVDP